MFKHNKGRYIVTSVLFRLTRKYSPKLEYGNIKSALEGADLEKLTPQQVRDAIIDIRNKKLPDPKVLGSAGSFFKNPVMPKAKYDAIVASEGCEVPHYELGDGAIKVPAAWMIDRCGFKGAVNGGAQVYEKQPLVIVNASGSATPDEIISLENQIISAVQQRFGVTLSPEVEHISTEA